MYFQHPEFLFGLFALLIPLAIHLFNFRRHKKIMFSNVALLRQVTLESKKQRNLLHLIVLALRMLAILLLVLALAKPVFHASDLKKAQQGGDKVIYIDNSFSMISEGNRGRLFNNAIHDAQQLVTAAQQDQRFIIRDNQSQGHALKSLNRDESLLKLSQIQISPATLLLSDMVMPLTNEEDDSKQVMIFSDFQKNTSDLLKLPADSNLSYYFFPLQSIRYNNLTVDSLWFTDPLLIPGRRTTCRVRLTNMAHTNYEKVPVMLTINGQQKAVAGVDLPANSSIDISMSYTPDKAGWHYGQVKIEDYPVTFDDELFFTIRVVPHIGILSISDDGLSPMLANLFNSDSLFSFYRQSARAINYNQLNQYNLIVLNALTEITSGLQEQLILYLKQGGHVLLVSANNRSEESMLRETGSGAITLVDTASTRVSGIKLSHPLFKNSISKIPDNADLPTVRQHTRYLFPSNSGVESLVTLLNGDDLLVRKKVGLGQLYLLSSGLNKTQGNISTNLLFVPMMAGLASLSGKQEPPYYVIGRDDQMRVKLDRTLQGETPVALHHVGDETMFIPEQQIQNNELRLSMHGNIQSSGYYNLMLRDSLLSAMAFNYSRSESDLSCYTLEQIDSLCRMANLPDYRIVELTEAGFPEVINALHKDRPIWKLFIIFALLALMAEGLLLRWRK